MECCVHPFVEILEKLVVLVIDMKEKIHVLEQGQCVELSLVVWPEVCADNSTDDGSSGKSDEIGDDSFLTGVLCLGFQVVWKHFRDVAELAL